MTQIFARPTGNTEQVKNKQIAYYNIANANEEWHEKIFRYIQPF